MGEIIRCFVKRMNMGAGTVDAAFHIRPKVKGETLRKDHTRLYGVLWLAFMVVWEFLKRMLCIFALVLAPISVIQSIPEEQRICYFLSVLFLVQFLGGVCSPLGCRHREPPITLLAQVFWERMKDLLYMPTVLYLMTYSMGMRFLDCLFIAFSLISWRLVMEVVFLQIRKKSRLAPRGETVLYVALGVLCCGVGFAMTFLPLGAQVGDVILTPPVLWLSYLMGAGALWLIQKRNSSPMQ